MFFVYQPETCRLPRLVDTLTINPVICESRISTIRCVAWLGTRVVGTRSQLPDNKHFTSGSDTNVCQINHLWKQYDICSFGPFYGAPSLAQVLVHREWERL